MNVIESNISTLKLTFSGKIILPHDDAYEKARNTHAVKDANPAVILQAKSNQDIAAAIDFAKTNGLVISVRSGGHSTAGFSTNNGGLVLDVSLMDSVEILDRQTGLVRLGTGALWGNVAVTLAEYKLALTAGDTKTVAVGGLTLGGGIGWMVRKYGYAIDSLVAAEVVLADGSVVRTTDSERSDLFWAIRGGGGNFGVVSSFEFKAHPQGKIVESTLVYAVDDLQKIIAGWRDHMRSAPEDLTSFMTLLPPGFAGTDPMVMIVNCYANDNLAQANAAIDPLRQLGNMLSDKTIVKEYAAMLQDAPSPPTTLKFITKSMFAETFTDELVAELSDICCKPKGPIVQLRMMNGAVSNLDPDATAMSHRRNEIFLFGGFSMPADTSVEEASHYLKPWDKLATHSSGAYSGFLSTVSDEDVAQVYPRATYERLAEIKHTYDPKNIFSQNFNIKPANHKD